MIHDSLPWRVWKSNQPELYPDWNAAISPEWNSRAADIRAFRRRAFLCWSLTLCLSKIRCSKMALWLFPNRSDSSLKAFRASLDNRKLVDFFMASIVPQNAVCVKGKG